MAAPAALGRVEVGELLEPADLVVVDGVAPLSEPEYPRLRDRAICDIVQATTAASKDRRRELSNHGGGRNLSKLGVGLAGGGAHASHTLSALRGQELHDGGLGGS